MLLSHILLAALWSIYCFLHSLLADLDFKRKMQLLMQDSFRYYRAGYTLFAFAGLAGIIYYQVIMESFVLFQPFLWLKLIGWFLVISGTVLMLVCIKKYFMSLSGLKSLLNEPDRSELMIDGIHRYIRHPLYLGTFMMLWGVFILYPLFSILISNVIITVYTLIGIRLEEKKLIREYGDAYLRYREKVPMIFPSGLFKR